MTFNLTTGNRRPIIGSPVDAALNPSKAVLSNQVYTSSDPTIFTVAPDPAVPGGAIITAVAVLAPGAPSVSASLTETALATEPDGTTTEKIQGVATIVIASVPPPPPPVAASIVFTAGPETPIVPPPPPPPPPPAQPV